jgi:hypothetical protein
MKRDYDVKVRVKGCPVFPGLPNISSAGSPISLPNIIILGVYPVLLFTEDLSAPHLDDG